MVNRYSVAAIARDPDRTETTEYVLASDYDALMLISNSNAVETAAARAKLAESRKTVLSDMSDALIRELHRQEMVRMRSEFDGAVLRVEPAAINYGTEDHPCSVPPPSAVPRDNLLSIRADTQQCIGDDGRSPRGAEHG